MRADIFELIKKHKHEIIDQWDLFDDEEVEDWFYYDDGFVLNVHDYDEDGILDIQAYGYDKDGNTDWGWLLFNDKITLEELKKL
jgi:hypothetical protein